jgi:hypothetical protein
MKRSFYVLAVAVIVCLPGTAMADAGSALLWTKAFHLLLGNAVFGAIEGLLIAWLFRRPVLTCVGLLIAANYLSAWVSFILMYALSGLLSLNLYNVWRWNWVLLALTFGLTLLLEWPFVAVSLKGAQHWLRKSLLATLLANCATYPVLVLMLWVFSNNSLAARAVPLSALQLPADVSVYYIGQGDGDVYRIDLPSGRAQHERDLGSVDGNDRLCVSPSQDRPGSYDLLAWLQNPHSFEGRLQLVKSGFSSCAAPLAFYHDGKALWSEADNEERGTNMSMQCASRVGSAKDSPLYVSPELGDSHGLLGQREDGSFAFRLAMDMPIAQWSACNVTHLPGDYIVFQLGEDQICIVEPKTRNVALLARGRGPVAVVR